MICSNNGIKQKPYVRGKKTLKLSLVTVNVHSRHTVCYLFAFIIFFCNLASFGLVESEILNII